MSERLTKLEAQKKLLEEKILKLQAHEKERERKVGNKRKFLFGAMVEAWIAEDATMKEQVMRRMEKFLTRNLDRRYFGLTLLQGAAANEGMKKNAQADGAQEA